MAGQIIRERLGAVERIWINRPDVGNLLNDEISDGIIAAMQEIATDDTVKVVILSGKGDTFSISADGPEIVEKYFGSRNAYRYYLQSVRKLHAAIETLPKPVIAAVNGRASCGGMELALSCDIIAGSSVATIGDTHPGGIGGGGGSQYLRDAIGARMTRWLLYTGELLSAERAFELGLFQCVYPEERFQEDVLALAEQIAGRTIGNSLERLKSITTNREPSEADLDFEINASVEHYFDPSTADELAAFLEAQQSGDN